MPDIALFTGEQKSGEWRQSLWLAEPLPMRRIGGLFHLETTLASCGGRRNSSYLWNWGDARDERVRFERETASVVEDGEVKLTEMIRIDDYFGFHDLFTLEFEAQHTRQASARSQNDSH